jgi:putative salt-induced outer membrane protein YdiY
MAWFVQGVRAMFLSVSRIISAVLVCLTVASLAHAQPPPPPLPARLDAPQPPPPPWTGSAGLGFSLNRGNTSTTNLNAAFEATHDPKTVSIWKFKGLYLRGDTNGARSVDRLLLDARYERTISTRVYGFAQVQFLEDQFKAIDYLWAPGGGIGYKLVATDTTKFNTDAGLGAKWEKNPGVDVRTDFIVTASDKFEHKLAKDSAITQGFTALWKADDFGDALYTFTAGVAAALTARTQVKLELLDAYVSRPPTADVKKNDVALITAFVYKF